MHHWTTATPTDLTFQAPFTGRCTPGWITRHTIVFPRHAAPKLPEPPDPPDHLRSLFLAAADRMADLAQHITRLERHTHAGRISPRHASATIRRILAALEKTLHHIDQTTL